MADHPEESLQDNLDEVISYARAGSLADYQEACAALAALRPEVCADPVGQVLAATNSQGLTALHMAAANGHMELLGYLLAQLPPVAVNRPNAEGNTALHWAAVAGQVEAVRELLKHQADPLAKNATGKTAITEAQQAGKEAVVDFLLANVDESRIELREDDDDESATTSTVSGANGVPGK
ncbi:ankyrin repeat-containing protein [Tieghemiomyces parasiticus]|uniref:Ankyrin repeat-containing protein n=1 Tax=Tieghemiomyces parasiticus TaxID=78921 RepID=A0A9W8DJK5_9FUNG|nr:ankyrin repeat-containing protein [Tieghemiomyces parasiticus]